MKDPEGKHLSDMQLLFHSEAAPAGAFHVSGVGEREELFNCQSAHTK